MDFGPHHKNCGTNGFHYLESYFSKRNARMDPNAEYSQADRDWRKAYKKLTKLDHNDGRIDMHQNPDYYKARFNIFRRIFRAPMDFVEYNIIAKMPYVPNWEHARALRSTASMVGGFMLLGWYITYYSLYKGNDWTKVSNKCHICVN